MAEILVKKISESHSYWNFEVLVKDGDSSTSHLVVVPRDTHARLTRGAATPEELVEKSFRFLLERESKESILRRFDLPVIGGYFPEYETEIRKRLKIPAYS